MPTYQYRCTECGRDLEVVQKFSDASLTECPTCAGQLRKIFNAVGVVFKGSGFYRNDSRAAANGGADGADKKSEAPSEKSSEKSGDKTSEKSGEKNGSTGDSKPVTTESSKPAKVPAAAGGSSSTGSKATSS